jgi:uncharacterized membrane protein YdbT with pleckstrin-like domain
VLNRSCFRLASARHIEHGDIIWYGKPWVIPVAIVRSITVFLIGTLFIVLEFYAGVTSLLLAVLPLWAWTIIVFTLIWAASMVELLIFWASNRYILRQDGLERRSGIIRLHSFVVTPSGFGDLLLYQSIGGRIFGYGDLTVNSQGERQTKLLYVREPFKIADIIRDVMGKPIVRVDKQV